MIFKFGKYKVDIDIEKTREFYERIENVTEGCDCQGCCNYERAVDYLPKEVLDFFSEICVDMKKVTEVYVEAGREDGTLLYSGFYHLCGTVLEGGSAWNEIEHDLSHWESTSTFIIADNFEVSFQNECILLEEECPSPAMQLEIQAVIPWMLEEPNIYV